MSMALAAGVDAQEWNSASLMPRGKDAFGNDTLMFGDKPIRAGFDRGSRPLLAFMDVLGICGIKSSSRGRIDVRAMFETYPFKTNGGRQNLRVIDLDDAYRVAMQGRSNECRGFRDFLVELLRKIESGQPINATQAPAAAPVPVASGGFLVQMTAALHNVAVELDAQQKRLETNEQRVEGLANQIAQIENKQAEAETQVRSLPAPSIEAPSKSDIDLTEQWVRLWCKKNGYDYWVAYRRLYEEIRRRLHFDVQRRYNSTLHATKLDVLRMEHPAGITMSDFQATVYAIAVEIFPSEARLFA